MGFSKKHKSLRRLLYICAGTTSTQESLLAAFTQKIEMENFPINFSRGISEEGGPPRFICSTLVVPALLSNVSQREA